MASTSKNWLLALSIFLVLGSGPWHGSKKSGGRERESSSQTRQGVMVGCYGARVYILVPILVIQARAIIGCVKMYFWSYKDLIHDDS